ncbi:MAG: multidrug transporter [Pseudomonadales bacterium]|nr:multidrug transporter [Pseudomonadales bacterium]
MNMIIRTTLFVLILGIVPQSAEAAKVEESPNAFTMAGDLLVARPIGLIIFALGSITYVATLPFSVAGGNVKEAGRALVIEPGREVFVRCLGCRKAGRKEKIVK